MNNDLNKVKSRYWAGVLYPDSLPDSWMELLELTGLPCAISPLHDQDINPTGEPKKPHYHLLVAWAGPTTYKNASYLFCDGLHGPSPMKVEHIGGYYRYLTHMDNPEKAQYDPNKIIKLNGFLIEDYTTLTELETDAINDFILDFIQIYKIKEYADLIDELRERGEASAVRFARHNTIYLKAYLDSKRWGS